MFSGCTIRARKRSHINPTGAKQRRSVHNGFFKSNQQPQKGLALVREIFGIDSRLTRLATGMYNNTYHPPFFPAQPVVNMEMKLSLDHFEDTKKVIMRHLDANRDTARKFSLLHMHIPGLHSIVMDVYPEALFRLYVIPPGGMHPSHVDWSLPFLRHPHRYDFISLPLVGSLWNQRSIEVTEGPKLWNKYQFGSAVTGSAPVLHHDSRIAMQLFPMEKYTPGQAYMMQHPEIHRAGFIPDDVRNEWAIVFFLEFRDQIRETPAYSEHVLKGIPEYDKLYKKPAAEEIDRLVDAVLARLAERRENRFVLS